MGQRRLYEFARKHAVPAKDVANQIKALGYEAMTVAQGREIGEWIKSEAERRAAELNADLEGFDAE